MDANGRERADISAWEWAQMERRVSGLEDLSVNVGALLGEVSRSRKAAEEARDIAKECFNEVNEMKPVVQELAKWKSDAPVVSMRAKLTALEDEKKEAARDALDLKNTIRGSAITGLVTLIVTMLGAYLLVKAGLRP